MFLYLVGSVAHVVHSGASGSRNVDALFLISGRTGTDATKSTKLVFSDLVGSAGLIGHSDASGA
jgi:hypothetical protein